MILFSWNFCSFVFCIVDQAYLRWTVSDVDSSVRVECVHCVFERRGETEWGGRSHWSQRTRYSVKDQRRGGWVRRNTNARETANLCPLACQFARSGDFTQLFSVPVRQKCHFDPWKMTASRMNQTYHTLLILLSCNSPHLLCTWRRLFLFSLFLSHSLSGSTTCLVSPLIARFAWSCGYTTPPGFASFVSRYLRVFRSIFQSLDVLKTRSLASRPWTGRPHYSFFCHT